MNEDDVWNLIAASGRAGREQHRREQFLRGSLEQISRAQLLDFVQLLSGLREPANTYRLWTAANVIMGGWCGGDSFHYFQMWLVGLGRAAYEAAIADPDSLAEVPEVRRLAEIPFPWENDHDYPDWETLEYVAVEVGNRRADIDGDVRDVVSEERAVRLRFDPDPADAEWSGLSTEEIARHYPRLWALFGERWRR